MGGGTVTNRSEVVAHFFLLHLGPFGPLGPLQDREGQLDPPKAKIKVGEPPGKK